MISSQENEYEILGVFVPKLLDMCVTKIRDSIDNIRDIGRLGDELLIQILSKCSPTQLINAENKLSGEGRELNTEDLWRKHVFTSYPSDVPSNTRNISWRNKYLELERREQERQQRVGMKLREKYDNSQIEKKSKQIKVIEPKNRSTSGGGGYVRKTSSPTSGGSPRNTTRANNTSSTTVYSSNSQAAKPAGRLMAKVLKEHRKSSPKPTSTVKVTYNR